MIGLSVGASKIVYAVSNHGCTVAVVCNEEVSQVLGDQADLFVKGLLRVQGIREGFHVLVCNFCVVAVPDVPIPGDASRGCHLDVKFYFYPEVGIESTKIQYPRKLGRALHFF